MKKIAFFSTFPLEYFGGFEKWMIDVSKDLLEKFKDEVDVTIVNLNKEWYEKFCKYLSFTKIINLKPTYRLKANTLEKKIGSLKNIQCSFNDLDQILNSFDVIYSKGEILELSILKLKKLNKKIDIIAGFHTAPYYRNKFGIQSYIHNLLYSPFLLKFLTKGIKKIHVLNEAQREYLSKIRGVDKIVKIHNPFNFKKFKEEADNHVYNINFQYKKPIIVRVGRFSKEKGIDRLLSIIRKYNYDYNWILVGEGSMLKDFQKELGTNKNIIFTGQVDSQSVSSIISQSQILLSTSYTECFPYNLLEGIAHNKYIVSYPNDGSLEILSFYENKKIIYNENEFPPQKQVGFLINKQLDNTNYDDYNPMIYQSLFELITK